MPDKELFERATRIAEQTIQDVFPSMDAALAVRYIEQLRDRIAAALREREPALRRAHSTIAFFASVIKSGERWSVTCQEALEQVQQDQVAEPATQPTPPREYNYVRNLTRIGDGLRKMMDGDRSGMSAQHMLEIVEQTLGAATQPTPQPSTCVRCNQVCPKPWTTCHRCGEPLCSISCEEWHLEKDVCWDESQPESGKESK